LSSSLKITGATWEMLCISIYASLSVVIASAIHGFWSENFAPVLVDRTPTSLGWGTFVGTVCGLLTGVLLFACLVDTNRMLAEGKITDWVVAGLVVFVIGLGDFISFRFIPEFFNLNNIAFFLSVAAVVSLGTSFYRQRRLIENKKASEFKIDELKLLHEETLEILRSLVEGGMILLAGFVLSSILTLPSQFEPGTPKQWAAQQSVLLTLTLVMYGILGYLFLCLLPQVLMLKSIRTKVSKI